MARSHHIIQLLYSRRGSVSILFALCLPVLLGLAVLSIDLTRLNLTKAELQSAADAAALAGARSLSDTEPPPGPSDIPYNWTAATASALNVAQSNIANAAQIQDAIIETGYWNLQNPSLGLRPHDAYGLPAAGDLPAIRTTIAISSTQNNGPLNLFFAPILGIDESNVQASAIAVLPAPEGGTGFFPFAISECILDSLWDSDTNSPVLDGSGDPIIFRIQTGSSCLTGQWTTFDSVSNSASYIKSLMDTGNPTELSVGDSTYLVPGTKATAYKKVKNYFSGETVPLFAVDGIVKGQSRPIVAITGFHITGASNQGTKYVEGHFINNGLFGGLDPGTGNGLPFGVYTSPVLVK